MTLEALFNLADSMILCRPTPGFGAWLATELYWVLFLRGAGLMAIPLVFFICSLSSWTLHFGLNLT